MEHSHAEHSHAGHSHDSCSPDLARDLVVTGMAEPGVHFLGDAHADAGQAQRGHDHAHAYGTHNEPSRTVSPVIAVTPFSLNAEVIARSEQVPVVVLLGSPVDPGMSALRRSLVTRATSAGLRWILATVDADRFPQVMRAFRPASLPTVTVVAGGTGVASWTPQDAVGDDGVDCVDWVDATISTVSARLSGLPEDAVIDSSAVSGEMAAGEPDLTTDPRLRQAADLVGSGDPEAAVDLYDRMLEDHTGIAARQMLHQARAAVSVLVRTKDLDRAAVYTALAAAKDRGEHRGLTQLLRSADVLVLADRPAEAVDLLSGSLEAPASPAGWSAAQREQIRVRLLDLILLLEPDAPAAVRARTRLASVLF